MWSLLDKHFPNPNWHGSIRSMEKCYTDQNVLTTDGTNLCLTKPYVIRVGEIGTPGGVPYLPIWRMCVPLCVPLGGWPIVGWWQRVTWSGWLGCPVGPHPKWWAACTSRGFCWGMESIKMASLMAIVTLCTSLPIMEKQSTLMVCPVDWLCWREL